MLLADLPVFWNANVGVFMGLRRKKATQFSFESYEEKLHPVELRGSTRTGSPGKGRKKQFLVQCLSSYFSLRKKLQDPSLLI